MTNGSRGVAPRPRRHGLPGSHVSPSDPPASRRGALAWLAPAVVVLLTGWPTLFYAHGRDQGSYAYAGWRLLSGEVPYRDVYAFKPPGSVWMHSLATALFGTDPSAIRILDLLWLTATAYAIGALTYTLSGRRGAAIWAAIVTVVVYLQVDHWNLAQTDGWLVLPAALSLWCAARADRPWIWVASGALAALAILFKYTAGVFVLPGLFALGLARAQDRRPLRGAVSLILGAVAVLGAAVLWLVVTGAWDAFADIQFSTIPEYVSGRRKNRDWSSTWSRLFELERHRADVGPMLWLAIGAPLGAATLWTRDRTDRWRMALIASLTPAALVGVVAQGKFYDYHYLPLMLPAAVGTGLLLDGLREMLQRALPHLLAIGFVWVLVLAPLPWSPWFGWAREGSRIVSGERTRDQTWRRAGRYRYKDYNVGEIEDAADWLRANSRPDEPVFAFTYEPAVLMRAERRQVSRFLYNYPLRVAWETRDYEGELLDALSVEPPVALVIGSKDARYGVTGTRWDSWQVLERSARLRGFVESGYCQVDRAGRYRLYTRCDGGEPLR